MEGLVKERLKVCSQRNQVLELHIVIANGNKSLHNTDSKQKVLVASSFFAASKKVSSPV